MQRLDLFTAIHKAIRALLFDAADRMQSVDVDDAAERTDFLAMVEDRLNFLREHAEKEDNYVFPAVSEFDREAVEAVEREHDHLHSLTDAVNVNLAWLRSAEAGERHQALTALRRSFHVLVAGHLYHMNHEEEQILPATQRYLTDEQLQSIFATIQKSIPPDRYAQWMQWMLPALQPMELAGMLRGMSMSAPKEAMDRILRLAEHSVDSQRLQRVLDLAGLRAAA